jgi:hypothetical protein
MVTNLNGDSGNGRSSFTNSGLFAHVSQELIALVIRKVPDTIDQGSHFVLRIIIGFSKPALYCALVAISDCRDRP